MKNFRGTTIIDSLKSNGISEDNIENKSGSNFAPTFDHHLLLFIILMDTIY